MHNLGKHATPWFEGCRALKLYKNSHKGVPTDIIAFVPETWIELTKMMKTIRKHILWGREYSQETLPLLMVSYVWTIVSVRNNQEQGSGEHFWPCQSVETRDRAGQVLLWGPSEISGITVTQPWDTGAEPPQFLAESINTPPCSKMSPSWVKNWRN